VERLLRATAAGVIALVVLACATWLFLRQQQASPAKAIVSQPVTPATLATSAPKSPDASASAEEPCREAVVLTWQSHSGVSARMTVQSTEGEDMATESAS
jgi:hypothetical protein